MKGKADLGAVPVARPVILALGNPFRGDLRISARLFQQVITEMAAARRTP